MWIIYVELRILQKLNVNDSVIVACCVVVGMQSPPRPVPSPSDPRTPKIQISKKVFPKRFRDIVIKMYNSLHQESIFFK